MENNQISTYIADERARGVTEEDIRKELLKKGWSETDIEKGMGQEVLQPQLAQALPHTGLIPLKDLFQETFKEFSEHALMAIGLIVMPFLVMFIGGMLFAFSPLAVIIMIAGFFFAIISSLALLKQITSEWKLGFTEAYTLGASMFFSLIWISILTCCVFVLVMVVISLPLILAGVLAGIFPSLATSVPALVWIILGIIYAAFALVIMVIFYIWYVFPKYALVYDGIRGIDALAYSRQLGRGLEGRIFLRLIAIIIPAIILSLIPVIGQLLVSLVISPFLIIYLARLYVNVRDHRSITAKEINPKNRSLTKAGAIIGAALLLAFITLAVVAGGKQAPRQSTDTQELQGFEMQNPAFGTDTVQSEE